MLICVEKRRNIVSESAKLLRVVELGSVGNSMADVSNLWVMECVSGVIAYSVLWLEVAFSNLSLCRFWRFEVPDESGVDGVEEDDAGAGVDEEEEEGEA